MLATAGMQAGHTSKIWWRPYSKIDLNTNLLYYYYTVTTNPFQLHSSLFKVFRDE